VCDHTSVLEARACSALASIVGHSHSACPKSASQRKRSDLQQVPGVALLERTGDGDSLIGWQLVDPRSKSFVCDDLVGLSWLGRTGGPVPLDLVGSDER